MDKLNSNLLFYLSFRVFRAFRGLEKKEFHGRNDKQLWNVRVKAPLTLAKNVWNIVSLSDFCRSKYPGLFSLLSNQQRSQTMHGNP